MVGERRKEEEKLESNNQLEKAGIINENLSELIDKINKREKQIDNISNLMVFIIISKELYQGN